MTKTCPIEGEPVTVLADGLSVVETVAFVDVGDEHPARVERTASEARAKNRMRIVGEYRSAR